MTNDLYLTQEALEKEARTLTIRKFNSAHEEKLAKNEESGTYYGSPLMKRAIEPVMIGIEELYAEAACGKAGKRMACIKFMQLFKPQVLAFFTAKVLLDRLTKKPVLQDMAINVGQYPEDELRLTSFEEQHPWLLKRIQNEKETTRSRKRSEIIAAYNRYCDEWVSWTKDEKLHVGMKLIEIFEDRTGFIEIGMSKKTPKGKHFKIVMPTASVISFIDNNRDVAALMQPVYLPMVVPPTDWSSPRGGGYLTPNIPPLQLIKTSNRNYLEELEGMSEQMQGVYDAVNIIQKTPWAINEFVLVAFQMIHERGLAVGDLPSAEDIPKPPSPLAADRDSTTLTETEKQAFKAWKKKASLIYDENVRINSKRLMVSRIKMIAEKFSVYEALYFVHNMDFRGRLYPAASHLSPQGNSLSKGLLRFADGKPLGTNEAAVELAIHGANCYGYDKASMQERVDWVVENQDRILQAGTDPMSDLWWAKEADSAWTFLAFCQEWVGYNENGYDHVSFIPCAKDGSCSGLQHFSAALRDPTGGAAVCLIPADRPSDIYQTVIDRTIVKVRADLGTEKGELAQLWLDFGMTRACSKRCTMTRVYGSTLYSARAFIQEYITDTDAKRKQEDKDYVSVMHDRAFEASIYLAQYVWSAINETVIAAKDGMDWLQDCAKELAKENLPIIWTTVDGMPIMQNYNDMKKRRVKTKFKDTLIYLTVQEAIKNKLDNRRQGSGISPNWVHANDSCHLRMSVNLAAHNGVTHFGVIHDSFSCHASDVEMFGACLREAFIDMYVNHDPLQMFKDEGEALLGKPLPDMPAKGNLDVTVVRDSEFFFA